MCFSFSWAFSIWQTFSIPPRPFKLRDGIALPLTFCCVSLQRVSNFILFYFSCLLQRLASFVSQLEFEIVPSIIDRKFFSGWNQLPLFEKLLWANWVPCRRFRCTFKHRRRMLSIERGKKKKPFFVLFWNLGSMKTKVWSIRVCLKNSNILFIPCQYVQAATLVTFAVHASAQLNHNIYIFFHF